MQILILVIGHNASGKSTLTKKIISQFDLNRVNGDVIRDLLISSVKFYSDMHYSYPNKKNESAGKIVFVFRRQLVKELLSQNQSIIVDGAGITKHGRNKYFLLAKEHRKKIKTVIIEAVLDENELLTRLKKRDNKKKQFRWINNYKEIRKERYEPVENTEADFVLKYNQHNSEEIIQAIEDIMLNQKK
ncbi:ATP-binding protein [Candidatus Parcubacteria bacterium]|nr:ATP-binding protein [Candidatus Parcubacteria bacterium]